VFISYHHTNDQVYKEALIQLNRDYDLFIDLSVDTGDINENLNDQAIRQIIRDDYLKDSVVTILLVGMETKNRKHVDWEIYSGMINGKINKRSGILVVNLPSTGCNYYRAAHGDDEKRTVYPDNTSWINITSRTEYERRYPHMPARIIDNLLKESAKISITDWGKITNNIENLRFLIDATFRDREQCEYDLSRPMRRMNL
jgi:hypothetical protein